MAKDYQVVDNKSIVPLVYRRPLELIFCFGLFSILTSLFLLFSTQVSFAQIPSSPETSASLGVEEANSQLAELEAARQQYMTAWNNTGFTSQFDVFIAEGSLGLFGEYREHVPANVFRPGETIVLYVEPVGFGHLPITDTSVEDVGNTEATSRTWYLMNMTADIYGTDSNGTQVFAIEDLAVASNLISHRQITEIPMTLTLTQEEPFPVDDYILTYVIHDDVTGQSFQIDKQITIDDNAVTGAAPLPNISINNSEQQPFAPQQQLEDRSQASEPGSLQNNTQ
jgi:hypothetical protein